MRNLLLIIAGLDVAGCSLGATPPGPPPPSGTYTSTLPDGPSFTIDAKGRWGNGDVRGCVTELSGSTLTLDCYGSRQTATWRPQPDGSVRTDVADKLYGEFEAVEYVYQRTP